MKVSAREVEQRQMILEVEVEDERMQRALDQAYRRIVNRINVPGFRKGRAPRPLVERMVGREALLEDAVDILVPQVYQDAIKEQQIVPAGQPSLQVTSTEPLQFKATVPLQPQVDLGDYRSIRAEVVPVLVEDEEVERVVNNLRESNATWVPVERAAQLGDRVGIDVKASREGRTVIDNKDVEFVMNPDGPEPVPGFSEKLVGMAAGDEQSFSIVPEAPPRAATSEAATPEAGESQVAATEAEPAEEIPAPVPTEFEVRLQWVKEKELPEVDDEFARSIGEKESLEELRDEIRQQIRSHKQTEDREQRVDSIVQQAIDQSTVTMAPQLVERQAQTLLENMAARLDKQGISIEQYLRFTGKDEDAFRSELMSEAERALRRSLVLEAVAEAEQLTVSETELQEEIQVAFQGSNDSARSVRQALARPETKSRIETILRTRKAVSLLEELSAAGDASTPTSTTVEDPEPVVASETSGETNV